MLLLLRLKRLWLLLWLLPRLPRHLALKWLGVERRLLHVLGLLMLRLPG